MVMPKIDSFQNIFGILSSQGFQIYKYHICCQYFGWADTGGHCEYYLAIQSDLLLKSNTYSYRTRILHDVSIFHNGNHATSVQNSGPMTVYISEIHRIENFHK